VIDAGLELGTLAGVAAMTTYVLRATPARKAMLIGTSALMAGVGIVMLWLWGDSLLGFFCGTSVAGVGFGAGFQGGIRLAAPLAEPGQRAGVLSVLYTVVYLGFAIPAVGAGIAVVRGGGLVATTYEYGRAVIVLAVAATINLIHLPSTETSSTSSQRRLIVEPTRRREGPPAPSSPPNPALAATADRPTHRKEEQ
jgi:hypothetical protein